MNKVSGVYKITNTITGDFYIGSSQDIKKRWLCHKSPSRWKIYANNPLYLDFQKYGLENFKFEIVEETCHLKEREQYFIDLLQPSYNNYRANGWDFERYKKRQKEYLQSTEVKEHYKKYQQTEKYKNICRKSTKKYYSRLCLYEGKTISLGTLSNKFQKQGILHPTLEAKKYLLEE